MSAVLWVGRLGPGERVAVPDAPHVHVYVARGSAELDGGDLDRSPLSTGDAARLAAAGAAGLVAGPGGAEVLVWETA